MAQQPTRYRFYDTPPEAHDAALSAHPPLVRTLLLNRGITAAADAAAFIAPEYESLHNPFLMIDMERAVVRILRAMADGERIAIFSDYDCDGIPGGVLLHDFFSAVGYENFENYIPHRHHEGYGMNTEAVDTLRRRGVSLIITVDCGITDVEPVAHAAAQGIDCIITDHHELGAELPPAHAVLNPKRGEYPFDGLCGAGVAFKLVQALVQRGKETGALALKDEWEKWWLDVVGMATVADMVPLIGENRVLAHFGLTVLRKSRRPGLQHLLRQARIEQRHLTEDDIGFIIGPRINAASRMDTPEDAFHMLAVTDEATAGDHVRHLERLNNERKGVVAAMVKEMKKRLAQISIPPVIVMGNPQWRPSLAGLAANTLAEQYARPAFVWGRDGQAVIKGSCRSGGTASVVALMHAAREHFLEYGGHHASGGFSVSNERIHTLEQALNDAHETLNADTTGVHTDVYVDAELTLEAVTDELLAAINALAPFGVANPKPLFAFRAVAPEAVATFGKGNEHTRVTLPPHGDAREAIAFFKTPEQFNAPLVRGEEVTLVAHIERSFFMRRHEIRLRIVDVLPSDYDLC